MTNLSLLEQPIDSVELYANKHTLLKSKDVRRLLGNISRSTFYRMIKTGQFPLQAGWVGHSRFWLVEQYHSWLKQKT